MLQGVDGVVIVAAFVFFQRPTSALILFPTQKLALKYGLYVAYFNAMALLFSEN